ncbi:VanZ family protein [Sporosarcina siberiensis]|uniref:VanZ family protein n=1 Tax=Sporosarcina siberiensis TaxID=1365606 RepID=A0ABW4SF22_9BACL
MRKLPWVLPVALILTCISTASLFYGDRMSDIFLTIILFVFIPSTIVLGFSALVTIGYGWMFPVVLILFAVFTGAAHLGLKVPFFIIALLAISVFLVSRISKYKTQGNVKIAREVGIYLFFTYLLIVFHLTFYPFQFIAPYTHVLEMQWSPFKEILTQYGRTPKLATYFAVGNIMMTIPFGFFLALLFKRCRNLIAIGVYGFGYSLTIELFQMLFTNRSAEIDDLIFNTSGALIGYILYAVIKKKYYPSV